ncbi:MAG: M23 family metallopeptidase [Paludibacteraceae bacterium]|nr:M23 family metallopeptidase [Paludibacteraceae bacterium]
MRSKNKLSFFKRMLVKYKISVLNEGTLEEVRSVRMSAFVFFLLSFLVLALLAVLFLWLLIGTPLRKFLPENVDASFKKEVVMTDLKVDSLMRIVEMNQSYLDAVQDILSGELSIDSTQRVDTTLLLLHKETLMGKSRKEKEFCERFETDEQYNLITTTSQVDQPVFFRPVVGTVQVPFDAENYHYGIDIATESSAAVSAVFHGVVIASSYSLKEGYYMYVVHKHDFISVYKNCSRVFKSVGDVVRTGEVIALSGNDPDSGNPHLHFELWNGMQVQNPENFIVFP